MCLDVQASNMFYIDWTLAFSAYSVSYTKIFSTKLYLLFTRLSILSKKYFPFLYCKISLTSGNFYHLSNKLTALPVELLKKY